jgi:hypothetical protein
MFVDASVGIQVRIPPFAREKSLVHFQYVVALFRVKEKQLICCLLFKIEPAVGLLNANPGSHSLSFSFLYNKKRQQIE